ncbi:MAG: metallophosphoesterase [Flavobacteriales bacterium]|nr:metallophosphoesterase [Flavobacteriales bacterium]
MFELILSAAIIGITYSIKSVFVLSKSLGRKRRWLVTSIYTLVTGGLFMYFFITSRDFQELRENNPALLDFVVGGFFTLMVTCLVMGLFHLVEDIIWVMKAIVRSVRGHSKVAEDLGGSKMTRSTFISKLGLGAGALALGSFVWGFTKGKFGWRIVEEELAFDNLPKSFDGTKIIQISDLHLGSFREQFEPLKEAIQLINELEPDYIFFTGDLVNTYFWEADPWVPVFQELKAKKGKFSILGNHDYGYYGDTSDEEQAACREGVIQRNKDMGFTPLINEHAILEENGERIGLLGVENWGESHWFPKVGDVSKAREGMPEVPFTMLLSHDPSHWDLHVQGKEDIDLTFSGHTHGAQMGLRIPGVLELSPAAIMFKRWAGLYKEGKQHLYINRGMGYLMMPGRVGMPPEITFMTLKSKA